MTTVQADENGYFYEAYVLIDDLVKAAVIITNNGVSIDFITGQTLFINIVPYKLFPDRKSLQWEDIYKILRIIDATDLYGKIYSKEEMEKSYQKWLKLGGSDVLPDKL